MWKRKVVDRQEGWWRRDEKEEFRASGRRSQLECVYVYLSRMGPKAKKSCALTQTSAAQLSDLRHKRGPKAQCKQALKSE